MNARRLLAGLLSVVVLVAATGANAGGFADGLRYVFVSTQDSAKVSVLDSRDDSVAGSLDLGLVPSQMDIAGEPGRLVAIDGGSARVTVVSTETGAGTMVPLDFVPTRLIVAGNRAVAALPAAGRLAVVAVETGKVVGQGQTTPFHDLQPVGDGAQLLLAPTVGDGLVLFDLAAMKVVAEVAPPRSGLGGFASLARSPNGRLVYARAIAAPVVVAVDVRAAKVVGEVAAGAGMPRAYTNAMGITLVLPDSTARSVTLVPSSLKGGASLRGEAGMTGVYSGWFDTVSFIPSTETRSVVVIDQQGGVRGDDITLGAIPGRGTVTPDGRKFYLPLMDANRVAVIDAERRQLVRTVTLPIRPAMALMGRTFGICH